MKKEYIMKVLHENVMEVIFTKKDGSERTMVCTLNLDNIPVEHHPKEKGKNKNTNNIVVYDIENRGWRSFILNNMKSFSKTNTYNIN
jgi:hypothetical protein